MSVPNVHPFLEAFTTNIGGVSVDHEGLSNLRKQVKTFIDISFRKLNSRSFSGLATALAQSAEELLSYIDPRDVNNMKFKIVGLSVLYCLLDVTDEAASDRRIIVAGYIRRVFELDRPSLDILASVIRLAGDTVSRLAQVALSNEIYYLQNLMSIAKKLLSKQVDTHKFSGLTILNALALNLPHLVYSDRAAIVDPIFEVMCDSNELLRSAAGLAFDSCLRAISHKEPVLDRILVASKICDDHITSMALERILGGLIILGVICGGGVIAHKDLHSLKFDFENLILKVTRLPKANRNTNVTIKVIELLPDMANAFYDIFCTPNRNLASTEGCFMAFTFSYLIEAIDSKSAITAPALVALGRMFCCCPPGQSNILNKFINFNKVSETINSSLPTANYRESALQCLGLYVEHIPIAKSLVDFDVVQLMFRGGFTEGLVENLKIVAKFVPDVCVTMQKQLQIYILSELNGETTGVVSGSVKLALNALMAPQFSPSSIVNTDHDTVSSIGNLYFGLIKIMRLFVIPRMEDRHADVRRLAALACSYIISSVSSYYKDKASNATLNEMVSAMDRLLLMCSGDDDDTLRLDLLFSFSPDLDRLLSLSSKTGCIINALSDGSVQIRCAAIRVLSRLASKDASRAMPAIILQLNHLIKQLGSTDDQTSEGQLTKYNAVCLLHSLVKGSDSFLFPYIPLILKALLPNMKSQSSMVVEYTLRVIGELGAISPESIYREIIEDLMPQLIRLLNDPFPRVTRETIVTAIGKLVPSLMNITSEPYKKYPGLLEGMIRAIQTSSADASVLIDESVSGGSWWEYNGNGSISDDNNKINSNSSSESSSSNNNNNSSSSSSSNPSRLQLEAIRTTGLLGVVDSDLYSRHLEMSRLFDSKIFLEENALAASSANGGVGKGKGKGANGINNSANDSDNDDDTVDDDLFMRRAQGDDAKGLAEEKGRDNNDKLSAPVRKDKEKEKEKEKEKNIEDSKVFKKNDILYTTIGVKQLVGIVKDDLCSEHHHNATIVTLRLVQIAGRVNAHYIKPLVDALLFRLQKTLNSRNSSDAITQHIIITIAAVIRYLGKHLKAYLDAFSNVVVDYAASSNCAKLVEALYQFSPLPYFQDCLKKFAPVLIEIMNDNAAAISERVDKPASSKYEERRVSGASQVAPNVSENESAISWILRVIIVISSRVGDLRHQFVNVTAAMFNKINLSLELRKTALYALVQLCVDVNHMQMHGHTVVQSALKCLTPSREDVPLHPAALAVLSLVLCRLKDSANQFLPTIRRRTQTIYQNTHRPAALDELESIMSLLTKNLPPPSLPTNVFEIQQFTGLLDSPLSPNSTGDDLNDSFKVNLESLETTWSLSRKSMDLAEWKKRLAIELIRQSPSPVIRAFLQLATDYAPLTEELFNPAFHSVWEEFYAGKYVEIGESIPIIDSIETALRSDNIPFPTMCSLLNLAEFMEIQDRTLPVDVQLLANLTETANMFSKSVRYREIIVTASCSRPTNAGILSLITLNNQLGLADRAKGVVDVVRGLDKKLQINPVWLEKLDKWSEAIEIYDQQNAAYAEEYRPLLQEQGDPWFMTGRVLDVPNEVETEDGSFMKPNYKAPAALEVELGLMRCLEALGDAESVLPMAHNMVKFLGTHSFETTENLDVNATEKWSAEVQRLGANAAWTLGRWEDMRSFVDTKRVDASVPNSTGINLNLNLNFNFASESIVSKDGANAFSQNSVMLNQHPNFYKTILAIHQQDYKSAKRIISDTRRQLSSAISSLLSEGYARAKRALVSMQILAELEEVVEFKQTAYISTFIDRSQDAIKYNPVKKASNETLVIDLVSRKKDLIKKWRDRLIRAPRDVSVFRQILAVHTLVVQPAEDLDSWLDLVALCRKEMKFPLCENILRQLGAPIPKVDKKTSYSDGSSDNNFVSESGISSLFSKVGMISGRGGFEGDQTSYNRVLYDTYKYFWAIGDREKALDGLNSLLCTLDLLLTFSSTDDKNRIPGSSAEMNYSLCIKCLLKKAQFIRDFNDTAMFEEAKEAILKTQAMDPKNSTAWHLWGIFNFERLQEPPQSEAFASQHMQFAIEAIKGLVQSITLNPDRTSSIALQDLLRLLTIWFQYGTQEGVSSVLSQQLRFISPDNWLEVLPQLIARMNNKSLAVELQQLLITVANAHPQACVFPFSVAVITQDKQQKLVAGDILADMRKLNSQLVEEAAQVSSELLKIVITPYEKWNSSIEKACEFYLAQNYKAMLHELLASHASMDDIFQASNVLTSQSGKNSFDIPFTEVMNNLGIGLNTDASEGSDGLVFNSIRDISFFHLFGRSLAEAREWIFDFMKTGNSAALHQAWELYLGVFLSTKAHFTTFKVMNLSLFSPYLTQAYNLSLTVPGAYKAGAPIIGISRFCQTINVLESKQRPRKIKIIGTDGHKYMFLLKGNEDLRLDERVMQLFGLINTCLSSDPSAINKGLGITRYSVLPLTNNSGLLEWVENCDTLYSVITKYREIRDVRPYTEFQLMHSRSLNYDMGLKPNKCKNTLTLLQKVEIFRSIVDETSGNDIAQSLWTSSRTADVWIERRDSFINSMSLMSMSGYILGLGDRHPSNLMMDRQSGRIVHIDFGDCFEVTESRPKFAEKIPFRLTRMLTQVMGSAGVKGPYKEVCMRTMSIMRENKDSLMAMLEAFVYNPLISWQFITGANDTDTKGAFQHHNEKDAIIELVGKGDEAEGDSKLDANEEVKDDKDDKKKTKGAREKSKSLMKFVSQSVNKLVGTANFDSAVASLVGADLAYLQDKEGEKEKEKERERERERQEKEKDAVLSLGVPETNTQGVRVIQRVQSKLTGTDFNKTKGAAALSIEEQVDRLISEATSEENLCMLYIGWMPFW